MRLSLIILAVAALGVSDVQAGIVSVRAIDSDVEITYTTIPGIPRANANGGLTLPALPGSLPMSADMLPHMSIHSASYGGSHATIRFRFRDAKMAADFAAAIEEKQRNDLTRRCS